MKKSSVILIIVVVGLLLSGCKYEEGPLISFRSAKQRIYGFHTLTSYSVDGQDSLSQYYDSLGLDFHFFYNDVSDLDVCVMDGPRKNGFGELYWTWELSHDKKNIEIIWAGSSSSGIGPFGNDKKPKWVIKKLKYNDIVLNTLFNNKEYKIELMRD